MQFEFGIETACLVCYNVYTIPFYKCYQKFNAGRSMHSLKTFLVDCTRMLTPLAYIVAGEWNEIKKSRGSITVIEISEILIKKHEQETICYYFMWLETVRKFIQ